MKEGPPGIFIMAEEAEDAYHRFNKRISEVSVLERPANVEEVLSRPKRRRLETDDEQSEYDGLSPAARDMITAAGEALVARAAESDAGKDTKNSFMSLL